MRSAHFNKLTTILCVGEDDKCRSEKEHKKFIINQLNDSLPETASLNNTIIAYEPIWAIGTGNSASLEDILDMHKFIHEYLSSKTQFSDGVPNIIYGGSVNPKNSKNITDLDYVNGVLIGGASLSAGDFSDIILSL